jgi:lipid-binding SYLF domain-containing protein
MTTSTIRRLLSTAVAATMTTVALSAALSPAQGKRVQQAADVLSAIHKVPDKDIPQELWNKSSCVMVVPDMKKAAFVVGGEYGKGLMSCRTGGNWSAPVFMRVEKGSFGLQIGGQEIDLVLLIMNDTGVQKLLNNKVTLGAEVSVAAGPVGRDARAATDAQLDAEILSYSRAQGLFAGINLSGGAVRPDDDDNVALYGRNVSPKQIVAGENIKVPAEAQPFMTALRR